MMGHAFNRPLCIRCQQEMCPILLQSRKGQCLSGRRIPDGLVSQSSLRISPSTSHPEGNRLSPARWRQRNPDSPVLAPPAMVHSPFNVALRFLTSVVLLHGPHRPRLSNTTGWTSEHAKMLHLTELSCHPSYRDNPPTGKCSLLVTHMCAFTETTKTKKRLLTCNHGSLSGTL